MPLEVSAVRSLSHAKAGKRLGKFLADNEATKRLAPSAVEHLQTLHNSHAEPKQKKQRRSEA